MPTGGLSMGLFEADLDNTSGRFTPRYMGGNSELFTSVQKVMRPVIINAGFHYSGLDNLIPQFIGLNYDQPKIDSRSRSLKMTGYDFMSYLQNSYLDHQIMFTAQRTDQVLANIMTTLGYATGQYDFDTGINVIPFGFFDVNAKFSDIIDQVVEAENGRIYQSPTGKLIFENRQHWDTAPNNVIQRVITTAMVIDAQSPDDTHLINVVEITSKNMVKQPLQVIMSFSTPTPIAAGSSVDLFFNFDDPVLQVINPSIGGSDSFYLANDAPDGTGADRTNDVSIKSISNFAQASKITFQNNSATPLTLSSVTISGRPVKNISDINVRVQDDSSVTAYQPRILQIDNDYIQSIDWANSYGQMIVNDFSEPENLQIITIRAMPDLDLGSYISWQGRYWRIFDIKTTLNPSVGFVQELTMLQRTISSYFRIGISTIGGSDKIAP